MKNLKNKSEGVTLLEIMLALVIIGAILLLATRFYSSSSELKRIADLNDQIGIIQSAIKRWSINHQDLSSGLTDTNSFKDFVEHGYLPSDYYTSSTALLTNQWGGTVIVKFLATTVNLSLGNISKPTAKKIQNYYKNILCQTPGPNIYVNPDMACNDATGICDMVFYFTTICGSGTS